MYILYYTSTLYTIVFCIRYFYVDNEYIEQLGRHIWVSLDTIPHSIYSRHLARLIRDTIRVTVWIGTIARQKQLGFNQRKRNLKDPRLADAQV